MPEGEVDLIVFALKGTITRLDSRYVTEKNRRPSLLHTFCGSQRTIRVVLMSHARYLASTPRNREAVCSCLCIKAKDLPGKETQEENGLMGTG